MSLVNIQSRYHEIPVLGTEERKNYGRDLSVEVEEQASMADAREAMPPAGLSSFGSTSLRDETKFYVLDFAATERNNPKRKNPLAPQGQISAAAKRPLTTTKHPLTSTNHPFISTNPSTTLATTCTFSNGLQSNIISVEQNNVVEDAERLSNDGKNEVNEESCKEIATGTDSKENTPKEEEEAGRQSQTSIVPMEFLQRQIKFPGFSKEMELVLHKTLNTVNPFSALYGKTLVHGRRLSC
ncbi:hypothetical protein FBU30_001123 [Linnemannia zychae]|nr:hypothetical protein FBU30_001123 [Linnemannia zychae]